MENGRRYCGDYIFPNDDLEQDRLRVVHQVFLNVFNFELTSVPLEDPKHILDIGTGTGEWAIGMAELFPSCEVVGVDISAIQPTAVPHNVFFEVDDCEVCCRFFSKTYTCSLSRIYFLTKVSGRMDAPRRYR